MNHAFVVIVATRPLIFPHLILPTVFALGLFVCYFAIRIAFNNYQIYPHFTM